MATNTTDKPAEKPADKPRSVWDTILTSTPIILTAVATTLAGLSSAEMTKAQYHRSLASQHQSKVGDQWGFFQAKRIRGSGKEIMVAQMRREHDTEPVTVEYIKSTVARLPKMYDSAEKEAKQLLTAIKAAGTDLGSSTLSESLRQAATKAERTAGERGKQASTLKERIDQALTTAEIRNALGYLNSAKLPSVDQETVGDANIQAASDAIRQRQTETETKPMMAKITEEELRKALDTAENNASAFEAKCDPLGKSLNQMGRLVAEERMLAKGFRRAVEELMAAMADVPMTGSNSLVDLRAAESALRRTNILISQLADELGDSYQAATEDFTARRYRREANDNQDIANVLEIQVRKSSWSSDRHRDRSLMFFYGMLAAQVGVVISTSALAVRRRSVLWGLATVAGLGAILFAAYVYLYT
jgi:hypothetical protein